MMEPLLPKRASIRIPTSARNKDISSSDDLASLFRDLDYGSVPLKPDADMRPLWIGDDGRIYLETSSLLYQQAQDFLIAIAEPISRPHFIHEYQMTPYSLYAAVSVGLETDDIIDVLQRLSKVPLSPGLFVFIRSCTESYGKLKLVLHHGRYWIETTHADLLQSLLKDPIVSEARADPTASLITAAILPSSYNKISSLLDHAQTDDDDLVTEEEEEEISHVYAFEVHPNGVEATKRRCIELDLPTLEEYDFRNDASNPSLNICLRSATAIRPYQEAALSKMFSNGRARSGIIVLPCGAGKTLVGITAACTIRKSALILCTSSVAVEQWKQQLKHFSTAGDDTIARFTSDNKERFAGSSGILITTYTMVAYGGRRSTEATHTMGLLRKTEWGLMILDEVHVVPANVFRRVLTVVAAHTKLGLTATLVREDDKIADLHFLIGPKLYEANWLDLARQGHIANVQCAEVWCPMHPPEFYREYLTETSRRRRLLYVMNPAKFQACQFLIQYHERRGDKTIVFSDNVYALKAYAIKLQKPFIYGPTSQIERMRILHQFQCNPNLNTIFLSKVGDTSIDLPEATCLIQISSHYGSRRQEAQRLGRILRAKQRTDDGFSAFFYSLVSRDTEEMFYSVKRQQFLVDQGYTFKVITHLKGMDEVRSSLVYPTRQEQLELLKSILLASENDVEEDEQLGETADDLDTVSAGFDSGVFRKRPASLSTLSGADDLAYVEYNKPVSTSKKPKHALFRQYYAKNK